MQKVLATSLTCLGCCKASGLTHWNVWAGTSKRSAPHLISVSDFHGYRDEKNTLLCLDAVMWELKAPYELQFSIFLQTRLNFEGWRLIFWDRLQKLKKKRSAIITLKDCKREESSGEAVLLRKTVLSQKFLYNFRKLLTRRADKVFRQFLPNMFLLSGQILPFVIF